MIQRGYRYRLYPTAEQETMFTQFAGVCRLVYNLAYEQRRDWWRQYRAFTGNGLGYVTQARELTELRREFDFIRDVSQTCQQQALRDLDRTYQNFYKGIASYPRPRKKGVNDSFRFQGREVAVKPLNRRYSIVRLHKIGWVKFRDTRRIKGKINNATIALAPNGWHIAFGLAYETEATATPTAQIGIDRGVANTLTLSTGERLCLPDTLAALDKKKRAAQRALSRRKRGSVRYGFARKRVASLQSRIARIRKDWHHQTTRRLANTCGTVVIEDLNTKGMTKSAKGSTESHGRNVKTKSGLNRVILNQGWHIFENLLTYKLEETGGVLVKVPAHNTSRTCFACGAVDKQSRKSQAVFVCTRCGHRDHADINAAKVILRRNTAPMLVEDRGCPAVEARTCDDVAIGNVLKNPPASAGGRC